LVYLLYVLEIIVCLFLILVILLQQGSGADLSVFGGGGTQTAFGARGTTQIIHKLTVWGFVAFILLTLAIAVIQRGPSGSSVMTDVEAPAAAPADAAPPLEAPPLGDTILPVEDAPTAPEAESEAPSAAEGEPEASAPDEGAGD